METTDDLSNAVASINARLESLERRVSAFEARSAQPALASAQPGVLEIPLPAAAGFALPQAEGVFSVVGKAMLGIAGAYVLRAVAESGFLPNLVVVALALAYAGTWLVWAARAPTARFRRAAFAATSALIFAPMLAELTLRFRVLPALVTAGLLVAFAIGASALAWKSSLSLLVWVIESAAVVTSLVLLTISHDLVPYIVALLVMGAANEFAAARGRWPSLRFLVPPVADIAMWIFVYVNSLPDSSRPQYVVASATALLALPSLLFLMCGASDIYRNALLHQPITAFEITQAVIAFLLTASSCLWFLPSMGRAVIAVSCWLLGAACYAMAFFCFDRTAEKRNYHVYSTWSAALVLAGSFLLLPRVPLALFLCVASVAATLVGVRMSRLTPEFHGLLYLTGAAFASSLLTYAGRALAGTFPASPGWTVWVVSISALACYAIGGNYPGQRWNERLLRLLAAILAVSAVATFLVSCLVWLATLGMTLGPSYVAVIRTLITCALALALAMGGSRLRRRELVWTGYGTLAFVTAKLLFEDLPQGHSGSIAISIFLYALTLIAVPRLSHTHHEEAIFREHEPGLTLKAVNRKTQQHDN